MKTPDYKIYGFGDGDRSGRIRWLLTELDIPFESQYLKWDQGDHDRPEYLKLNPMGMIPTLTEGGTPMMESVAICLYLADKYQSRKALAPPVDSPNRAEYLQWSLFLAATIDPKFNELMYLRFSKDEERIRKESPRLIEDLKFMAAILERALIQRDFLVQGEFSAADIVCGLMAHWLLDEQCLNPQEFPGLSHYVERLKKRPALEKSGVMRS